MSRAAVSIEIANESGVDVDEADLAALARHVLDGMRMHPLAELSVLLVDRGTMSDLHERWMGEPGPTDVLAFPMDELRPPPRSRRRAGSGRGRGTDVAARPARRRRALSRGRRRPGQPGAHPLRDELELLCTHGILHLLGYDHAEADEHTAMFGLQDKLLATWRSARDEPPGRPGDQEGQEGTG